MATRRRSRFSTLTNTVSDINQRLRYVEKRRSYSRLANQVVRRQNIQPKSVATDQLANSSVTTEIIDDDAVTSAKIADGTIQSVNIGPGSIQNVNMGGGQVDGRVLADNTIESRHIKDGEVKEGDLGVDAVTTPKIKGLAVTNDKLAGSISNDKLAGGITNDKLAGSISNDKLAGGITNDKLAGGITNEKLAGGITNEKLAGGITNAKLAGGITNEKLAGNITNDKLAGGITNAKLAGGITRDKINPQIISTVSAGSGLSGGGSANSVTLSVNFDSVARTGHTHTQYATANHTHNNYASSSHQHTFSQNTSSGGSPSHQHFVTGGVGGVISSSLKAKTDIEDYEFDVEKILNLQLKKFKYKKPYRPRNRPDDWFYGFIAEELLESGFPEVVVTNIEGEPVAIDYTLISTLLVEVVQKQQKDIEELKNTVKKISEEIGR